MYLPYPEWRRDWPDEARQPAAMWLRHGANSCRTEVLKDEGGGKRGSLCALGSFPKHGWWSFLFRRRSSVRCFSVRYMHRVLSLSTWHALIQRRRNGERVTFLAGLLIRNVSRPWGPDPRPGDGKSSGSHLPDDVLRV